MYFPLFNSKVRTYGLLKIKPLARIAQPKSKRQTPAILTNANQGGN